jgi:hypothetical protein
VFSCLSRRRRINGQGAALLSRRRVAHHGLRSPPSRMRSTRMARSRVSSVLCQTAVIARRPTRAGMTKIANCTASRVNTEPTVTPHNTRFRRSAPNSRSRAHYSPGSSTMPPPSSAPGRRTGPGTVGRPHDPFQRLANGRTAQGPCSLPALCLTTPAATPSGCVVHGQSW